MTAGEAENSVEAKAAMCTMCWVALPGSPSTRVRGCLTFEVWRKLPPNYFPPYVNELVCDGAEGSPERSCLSGPPTPFLWGLGRGIAGWGDCFQRHQTVSVLVNNGTEASPLWMPASFRIRYPPSSSN